MALLADFQDTFDKSKRYHMIHSYQVDRVAKQIEVKVWIFRDAAQRQAMKESVAAANALGELIEATSTVAKETQAEFNALPGDQRTQKRLDYERQMGDFRLKLQDLNTQVEVQRNTANANMASAERKLTVSSVDPENLTLSDLYKAVSPLLDNAEDIQ